SPYRPRHPKLPGNNAPPTRTMPPKNGGNTDCRQTGSHHFRNLFIARNSLTGIRFRPPHPPLQGPPKFESIDEFSTLWQVETKIDLPSAARRFGPRSHSKGSQQN